MLDQTSVGEDTRDRIRTYIAKDFSAGRTLSESSQPSANREQPRPIAKSSAFEEMAAIRARGRENWLKLRRQQAANSRDPEADSADSRRLHDAAKDVGKGADEDLPE